MRFIRAFCLIIAIFLLAQNAQAQKSVYTTNDSIFVKSIFNEALLRGHSYSRLGELCKQIGARLSGSDAAEKGIIWAMNMLNSYQFDSVYKQNVLVPRWQRGTADKIEFQSPLLNTLIKQKNTFSQVQNNIAKNAFPNSPNALYECDQFLKENQKIKSWYSLPACALGGSIDGNVKAKVISVNSKKQLDELGKIGALKNKIVLLNQPMDEALLNTFSAYGGCVSQRVQGANWCAPFGALAVLVRSVSHKCDLHPHTGVTHYEDSIKKIPMVAVATAAADIIDYLCKNDPNFYLSIQLNCKTLPDRMSANVIAETKGIKNPKKVIVFGGHFDSWDQGEGAHDDGAGCMHAFEALRILKALGYQPKHTLRCVFWINEENGLRGGNEYAKLTHENGDIHVAALESDRGGFTPRGFGIDTSILPRIKVFQSLLDQFGIGTLENGGGGADIGPIKKYNTNTAFISFIPDSQRYFDVHHAETDVFESVNKRELELGSAAIAAMIYILDQQLD